MTRSAHRRERTYRSCRRSPTAPASTSARMQTPTLLVDSDRHAKPEAQEEDEAAEPQHSPSSAGLPFPDGNWFAQPTWQTTTKTSPHARIVPSLSERDSSKPGTRTQVRARSHAPRPRRDKIVAPLRRLELRPRKTAARREGVVEGGDGAVVGQL